MLTIRKTATQDFELPVVLLAGGPGTRMRVVSESINKTMLEIAGRPVIEYWLTQFAEQRVRRVCLCVGHQSASVADYIGQGEKWGINVVQSVEREPLGTGAALARIHPESGTAYVALYGDIVGAADLRWMRDQHTEASRPATRFITDDGACIGWIIDGGLFAGIPDHQALDIETHLGSSRLNISTIVIPGAFADINTPDDLINAQRRVLTGELLPSPVVVCDEPGVHIGKNVALQDGVRLIAPVFIGNDVTVMKDAVIGPNVGISKGCVIERNAHIANSAVQPGTFIGQSITIQDAVARPYQVVNRNGSDVNHIEQHLVGIHRIEQFDIIARVIHCLFAFLTLPVWLPLIGLVGMAIRLVSGQHGIIGRSTLATGPANHGRISFRRYEFNISADRTGRHLALQLFIQLPSLLNMLVGQVRWVGIAPVATTDSVILESPFWPVLKRGNIGIFSYSKVNACANASLNERLMCDTWYVAHHGLFFDLMVVAKGVLAVIGATRSRRLNPRNASVSSV
ncbi:MAG: NDP-sugar synthase [Planctomycetota bacterium]